MEGFLSVGIVFTVQAAEEAPDALPELVFTGWEAEAESFCWLAVFTAGSKEDEEAICEVSPYPEKLRGDSTVRTSLRGRSRPWGDILR